MRGLRGEDYIEIQKEKERGEEKRVREDGRGEEGKGEEKKSRVGEETRRRRKKERMRGGAVFLAMQVLEIPAGGRGFPLVSLYLYIGLNALMGTGGQPGFQTNKCWKQKPSFTLKHFSTYVLFFRSCPGSDGHDMCPCSAPTLTHAPRILTTS